MPRKIDQSIGIDWLVTPDPEPLQYKRRFQEYIRIV